MKKSFFFLFIMAILWTSSIFADSFLALADIHFDPFQSCGKSIPCPLVEALRKAPASAWPSILERLDTSRPRLFQDTDYVLLHSTFEETKQIADEQKPQFILMLGDMLGHQYRELFKRYTQNTSQTDYQMFVNKTLQFIAAETKNSFVGMNVYSALGNNDSYYGDYVSFPRNRFFSETAAVWSGLISETSSKQAMLNQFSQAGYYAVTIPRVPNLRLIVLNTNLFSYKARGREINKMAAQELVWFHQQLQQARRDHQKVLIAMHIPTNIDIYASLRMRLLRVSVLWQSNIANKFELEIKDYSDLIIGIISGHLHSEWLHIQTLPNKDQIPLVGVPAISPAFGSAPSIKLLYFSPQSLLLQNYLVYSYGFKANERWHLEFDFNKTYHNNCNDCALIELGSTALFPGEMPGVDLMKRV